MAYEFNSDSTINNKIQNENDINGTNTNIINNSNFSLLENEINNNIDTKLYKKLSYIGENWISSNQDKNFKINCTQTFKLFDLEIPIFNEFPGLELENIASIEEKSTKALEAEFDIINRKRKIFKTTSRGRKSKDGIEMGQTKIHNKSAKDNILRKVNVYFLKFAVKLSNEVVEKFGFERNFIDLDHSIKKNITQKSLKGLKSLTFGELLCKNISKKYRKHSFNENEIFYKKVIENENIKRIFSEKYMTIFGIFLKSQRNIKIGHYDFDLSPKINMFDSFLSNIENKYKNDDSYIKKIKEVIQDY